MGLIFRNTNALGGFADLARVIVIGEFAPPDERLRKHQPPCQVQRPLRRRDTGTGSASGKLSVATASCHRIGGNY